MKECRAPALVTFAGSVGAPQHRALVDAAEGFEHLPHVFV